MLNYLQFWTYLLVLFFRYHSAHSRHVKPWKNGRTSVHVSCSYLQIEIPRRMCARVRDCVCSHSLSASVMSLLCHCSSLVPTFRCRCSRLLPVRCRVLFQLPKFCRIGQLTRSTKLFQDDLSFKGHNVTQLTVFNGYFHIF